MNPYRIAERIGRIVGIAILSILVILMLVGVSIRMYEELGWWAVLAIPAIPAAFLILGLVLAVCVQIQYQWAKRKRAWDRRAIDTKEETS